MFFKNIDSLKTLKARKAFYAELKYLRTKYDVLILVEINTDSVEHLKVPGYTLIHFEFSKFVPNAPKQREGVAIFVRTNLRGLTFKSLAAVHALNVSFDSVWVEMKTSNTQYLLGGFYRNVKIPNGEFFYAYTDRLQLINEMFPHHRKILMCDSNFQSKLVSEYNTQSTHDANKFLAFTYSFGYHLLNDSGEPTFIYPTGSSCIVVV